MMTVTFVDGIGPPLEQLEADYINERATYARDVLALIAETKRLREVLRWIALGRTGSYGSAEEFAKAVIDS